MGWVKRLAGERLPWGLQSCKDASSLVVGQPYLSLEAELHDAFWEAEDDASEVRLMADFLKKYPGVALEMGAGSGRLMLPLVQLGHEVEGLELSKDMLELGRERAARQGVRALMHEGDMSSWNLGKRYSALLAPAFTLQLADDPAATLLHWYGLLENFGGLYLTVFMPYAELLGDLPENQWYSDHSVILPDGREGLLETRHRLDRVKQIVHREHRYSIRGEEGRVHQSRQDIHWLEHDPLLELLARCGFQVEKFFVDFDPKRVVSHPDRMDFDGILTYHATRASGSGEVC